MRTCKYEDCGREILCKGMCKKHYQQEHHERRKVNKCECGGMTAFRFVWGHQTRLYSSEEQRRRGLGNNGDKLRDRLRGGDTYRKVKGRHEHRIVMEEILGRPLESDEIVHHKDGNRRNNNPENLEVMSQAEHINLHREEIEEGRRRKLKNEN